MDGSSHDEFEVRAQLLYFLGVLIYLLNGEALGDSKGVLMM